MSGQQSRFASSSPARAKPQLPANTAGGCSYHRRRRKQDLAGRQTLVSVDGLFFLTLASAVLAGCVDMVRVSVYRWREGGWSAADSVVHETIFFAGIPGGHGFTSGSTSLDQKLGLTFIDEQRKRGSKFLKKILLVVSVFATIPSGFLLVVD